MSTSINVKIAPLPRGEWSASNTYAKLDWVYDTTTNASYLATKSVSAGTAVTNTTYWQKIADGQAILHDGVITTAMLADDAVTTDKIADEAVTGEKLSEDILNAIYASFPVDTAKGDIVSFPDGADNVPVRELKLNLEPYQNLNGYDSPWVIGAGRNKLSAMKSTTSILSDAVKLTETSTHGKYTLTGTNTTTSGQVLILSEEYESITFKAGKTYRLSGNWTNLTGGASTARVDIRTNVAQTVLFTETDSSYTPSADTTGHLCVRLGPSYAVPSNVTLAPVLTEDNTDTSFIPNENICPIYPSNGKNLLPKFTSGTSSNLTYTVNDDGSVHVTGTNTGTAFYAVQFTLDKGDYILSGAPKDGQLTIRNALGGGAPSAEFSGTFDDYGSEARFSVSATASAWLNIRTVAGTWDTTYYPMIRHAEVSSPTYVPQDSLGIVRTGKNLLHNRVANDVRSTQSVTFTRRADGSILVNGTASANAFYSFGTVSGSADLTVTDYEYNRFIGQSMRLTGTPSDVGSNNIRIMVVPSDGGSYANDTGSGATFTMQKDTWFCIRIASGTTVNNAVFYPMLQFASDDDRTYEPYNSIPSYINNYNFWDEEWRIGEYSMADGSFTADSTHFASKNPIPVQPNTTYYLGSSVNATFRVFYYNADKQFVGYEANGTTNSTFTTISTAHYIQFSSTSGFYGTTYNHDIIINYSNPAQVGYGGTLEVETGVLTVTHTFKTLTTANLNISYVSGASDANSYYYNITNAFSSGEIANDASGKSDIFLWYTNLYSNKAVEGLTGTGAYVSVRVNSSRVADTSANALKAYLPATWEVCAKLNNPTTYQLTPVQVKTLLGYNNIWTDTSTIDLVYLANIGLYIQKIIGASEDDMVANQNIASGKYFFVGEELYYSTQAIASGQSIIVGTNCTKTTLADALNALNS